MKSTMPFAIFGLRYSSKYFAVQEKTLAKVKQDVCIVVIKKDLVAANLIDSTS